MMWMMGYNDAGEYMNTINQDPFTGRSKLRPIMPRPSTNPSPPCYFHGTDFLALNHHHLAMVEQNKREVNMMSQQVVVSSRWNPTPEQLQTLEELYRRGTRTPSAEQIQQITAQLRRYGKIEGKNVFYWFQNHKARERQKRRRQLDSLPDEQQPNNNNNHTEKGEKREPPGLTRIAIEDEQTKNWASPTNSSTMAEKTTVQGASKATETECKADGWVQFDDPAQILQQRRNATWQMMHLSCSNNNSSSSNLTSNLILNPSSSSTSTTIPSTLTTTTQIKQPYDIRHDFIDTIFLEPRENHDHPNSSVEAQTLELFPLRSCRRDRLNDDEFEEDQGEGELGGSMNSSASDDDHVVTTPYQFFEFLPLKN